MPKEYCIEKSQDSCSLSFYTYTIFIQSNPFKLKFIKDIEELGINYRHDDFLTPLEASVIGTNEAELIQHLLSQSSQQGNNDLENTLSLAVNANKPTQNMLEILKVFTTERTINFHYNISSHPPLIDEIINNYNQYHSPLILEALKHLKHYNGYEDIIVELFTKQDIETLLKNFEIPQKLMIFLSENYEELSKNLHKCKELNKRVLHFITFESCLDSQSKIKLIDEFVELGGNIDIVHDENSDYFKRLQVEIPG